MDYFDSKYPFGRAEALTVKEGLVVEPKGVASVRSLDDLPSLADRLSPVQRLPTQNLEQSLAQNPAGDLKEEPVHPFPS